MASVSTGEADITDPVSLAKVREWKKAQKAAKREKQDRPA